jgi:hypothetical protein
MKSFWSAHESPRVVAIIRMALAGILLFDAALRWPYVVELFSTAGLPMPLHVGTPFEPPALSATLAALLFSLKLFALFAVLIGWRTRLSLVVLFVLFGWLGLLDFIGSFKKYSVISLHMLFLLTFTNSGGVWSVERWRSRNRDVSTSLSPPFSPPLSPLWPRRLMQILLCTIYLGAVITKVRRRDFATGDLLMFSLLDDRWGGGWFGQWLSTQPHLLVLASMSTIFFEIAFPLLIWMPQLRRSMIVCGILFHLGLAAGMSLAVFSPIMLVLLLAFANESDLQWVASGLRRLPMMGKHFPSRDSSITRAPLTTPSPPRTDSAGRVVWGLLVYTAAAATAMGLGYAQQRSADWYGVFDGSINERLVPLNKDNVEYVLSEESPEFHEYIHRIEIGSRVSNFHMFGKREQFTSSDVVHVLIRLVQEHPPMELQAMLLAPDGQTSDQFLIPLQTAQTHATIGFRLSPNMKPGRYRIVIQINGYDVAEQTFELVKR